MRHLARHRQMLNRLASLGVTGMTGLFFVTVIIAITIIGPFVTPHSPTSFVGVPFQLPSRGFPLGTDALGRDAFSRVLDGGYRIVGSAAVATLIGVLSGAFLGILAGYIKGAIDELIMRLADVAMAFPQIILALLFISIFGAKLWLVTVMVGIVHLPQVARVARAATLRVAQEDFVLYAESLGTPLWKIMGREIFPNIITPLMVEFGIRLAYSIIIIAGLSFLGFGAQPPAADWGLMINENRIGLFANPWPVLVPIILIALLTIGMNLFTDAIARSMLAMSAQFLPEGPLSDDAPDQAELLLTKN